jgi:hypothetical protein
MFKKLIYLTSFVLVLALAGTNVALGQLVWEGRIDSSFDDLEEDVSDGGYDDTSSDLELPSESAGGSRQIIGLRFLKVPVPPGADITNAYIEFVCDEVKGGTQPVSLIIEGELNPNPPRFSTAAPFNISSRPRTTAKVVWVPVNWTAVDQKDQTPNITSVIQEIIGQPGWVSGSSLVIIITDDPANPSTGVRCAEAYDGTSSEAALLHIEWTRVQKYATGPNPSDGKIDVPRDVVLSWKPGFYAAPTNGHKVYLSENFNDVNEGIGGITHSTDSYAPGRLDFSTTYYWRVDEVNGAPDYTVHEGSVWSFTTELLAYPIENITATASSAKEAGVGPENTVNRSGLDDNDLHSNEETDMWLSGAEPLGAWIEYEFDKVYKLHQMWVWNYNQTIESILGFGFKDVTIEYSTNGTDYTTLGTTVEFPRAPSAAGYAHDITIDFGGEGAKYVRLTATSNWGGILPQYGLSEVRFFYIPVNATKPYPESGATDVVRDVVLGWQAGRGAVTHNVYISTDEQAVADGTAPVVTVAEPSYGPLALDLGVTHYWRVNEVNEAETITTWESELWSFTTSDHIVVDDFESYNDLDPGDPASNRIFNVWLDGYQVPTNGSLVGYDAAPFAEQTIVYGGKQSMPLAYSNTGGATYSEAELTLSPPQNWTEASVAILALHFHGTAGNTGQLYVKVNGSKVTYDGQASNLTLAMWQVWNIDLASLGAGLQSVTKLAIGVDGNGASGTLYFDDIGLYVLAPVAANEWTIATDDDDVEEVVGTGNIDMGSGDLELAYENTGQSTPQVIGLRYTGIPIPKGAAITEAWVQFGVDETKGGTEPVNLIIEGELSADAAAFTSDAFNVTSRDRTTAQVQWSVPNWTNVGDRGPDQTTPNIASIIQEIVNQDGWAAGNALVLIFSDDPANPSSGVRCAVAGSGSVLLNIRI